MKAGCSFPESNLTRLREVGCQEPRLAAIYAVSEPDKSGLCDLAALFTESPPWPGRVELELDVADALELDRVELIDLRRMSLVFRFGVVDRGELLYIGQPDELAKFIEDTIVRYAEYYPLLEALYWKVETTSKADDSP
jgi:hypothetical protein